MPEQPVAEVSSFPSCSSVCQMCEGKGEPGRPKKLEKAFEVMGDAEGPVVDG